MSKVKRDLTIRQFYRKNAYNNLEKNKVFGGNNIKTNYLKSEVRYEYSIDKSRNSYNILEFS
jgi:hypothetical protein